MRPRQEEPWWREVFESLTEPLQLLLLAVAVAYFVLGERQDAVTILVVVLAVAAIEVTNELRAKRAVAALSALSAPTAQLIRDGKPIEVPASAVVPGDLVLLAPGLRVPADLRLLQTAGLRVDESSLTGESVPVGKDADANLEESTEVADRRTMAFCGTLVTAGKARGVAVATGRETQISRIAGLVEAAREPRTPLQQALRQLSRWLLWAAIGFSVLVPVLGVLIGARPWNEMLLIGLTLAFATIPEELPILITIVLGLGAYRLAQRHAIVKRLRAAEILGIVSVVVTDKTGTLTENRMRVSTVLIEGEQRSAAQAAKSPTGRVLLETAVFANDAQAMRIGGQVEFIGDPTETALLAAAEEVGIDVEALRRGVHVLQEHPFCDLRKCMSIVFERDGRRWVAAKGAPESILQVSIAGDRGAILDAASAMAARGLRVLAIAQRRLDPEEGAETPDLAERDLVVLGLIGLEDPPRAEAAAAVWALQRAGIRVLMLTGDHPVTARSIAQQVGIDARRVLRGSQLDVAAEGELRILVRRTSVFARISPEHKLRVVRALQAEGEIVAVTGDGVNDAPALRAASIGIAMGRGGTDVAREAADLVLADDNFATVTEAVRSGRMLFANLRKAIRYYLAAKVALVLASLAAVLLKLPVPFEPIQIIMMELFMDLGASVTFVAEPAEKDLMSRPPRDARQPFMDRSMQVGILFGGLLLGGSVLVAYLSAWALLEDVAHAKTAAFATWMIGHVVLAAHMRAEQQSLFRTRLLANAPFLIWSAAAAGLLVLAMTVPVLRQRLHVVALDSTVWVVAVASALLLPSLWEPWKWLQRRAATGSTAPAA